MNKTTKLLSLAVASLLAACSNQASPAKKLRLLLLKQQCNRQRKLLLQL